VSGGIVGAANFDQFRITGSNPSNIDYKTMTGWSVGGWVNFPVSTGFSIEPQVMHSSYRYYTSATNDLLINDGKIRYISVPLLLKFHPGDKFAITLGPQFDFTSSVENMNGNSTNEDELKQTSISGSAGLELFPHGRVTLFGRYIHGFTNMNNLSNESGALEYKNQNIQAGLKLRLFGKKVDADSDGDGVIDKNDKCPGAFGYARYDGCPIPDTDGDGINDEEDKCPNQAGTSKYNGCPIPDTDGDGINDEQDKCPNQAGTAKYNGCPVPDTDGDGINDELDKCPNQPGPANRDGCPVTDRDNDGINDDEDKCPDVAGVASNNGCPEVRQLSAEVSKAVSTVGQSITFTTNSAKLATTSNSSLNRLVTVLKNDQDLKVKIIGHTDNAEKDDNMKVSEGRADAVKTYLVSKGISADRITVEGMGSSMPIAENNTAAGRAKNRRVEIQVMY
jgi:outer membrane protein OmpA-like peptidoglycan-associated protein